MLCVWQKTLNDNFVKKNVFLYFPKNDSFKIFGCYQGIEDG